MLFTKDPKLNQEKHAHSIPLFIREPGEGKHVKLSEFAGRVFIPPPSLPGHGPEQPEAASGGSVVRSDARGNLPPPRQSRRTVLLDVRFPNFLPNGARRFAQNICRKLKRGAGTLVSKLAMGKVMSSSQNQRYTRRATLFQTKNDTPSPQILRLRPQHELRSVSLGRV